MNNLNNELDNSINWKHQLVALLYNVQVCGLYFASANEFFSHVSRSPYTPAQFKQSWMKSDIAEFSAKWQLGVFFGVVLPATMALFITNQNSMPERLAQLQTGRTPKTPSYKLPTKMIFPISLLSGMWKMIISDADLLATAADFKIPGFWGGLALTIAASPGDIVAQLYNFMSEKPLANITNRYLRGSLALYLAIGYAAGCMGLYGNTVNRAFYKAGWVAQPLSQIPTLLPSLFINGGHLFFNLLFGYQTAKQYYPRFQKMLGNTIGQTEQQYLLEDGDHPVEYSLLNRFDAAGFTAAFYKTFAILLSLLMVSELFIDFKEMNAVKSLYVIAICALQFVSNLPMQLTFYAGKTDEQLRVERADPAVTGMRGTINKMGRLFHCCKQENDMIVSAYTPLQL